MSPAGKIIEIKDATVFRGNTKVFENFSLEIDRGSNTAIIGPNGAGKTTLLKLLSRDLYPVHRDGSYVRILGRGGWNVWDLRSQLGIVSHDLQHDYAGYVRGIDVVLSGYYASIGTYDYQEFTPQQLQRAEQILATLGIVHLKEKGFAAMSTGEQRRFLLGRALINEPHTLVLDEPTTSLDLKATFKYLTIIRKLMQEGRTVVLITHHLHDIPPEVTRVILLKDGSVVAQGEKEQVLTDNNLSHLFDTPIKLVRENGFYQAIPAGV
ncbi:MAG: ABC transporter ATP-binding protein [Acidiferrobacterales bacterium]